VRRLSTALAVSALLLAGCSSTPINANNPGGTPATPGASTPTSPDTIIIKDFNFSPTNLTVAPGAKVTVTNQGAVTHTLTSTATPHAFDTGDINPGTTVTLTAPTKPGSYPYICTIHTFMQGTLTVS
jgi:plastocyanin